MADTALRADTALTQEEVESGTQRVARLQRDLLRFCLRNPSGTAAEAAEELGVTPNWISLIRHSDAFKELLHSAQCTIDTIAIQEVGDRAQGLADLSLDILTERLTQHRMQMPLAEVRACAELALRILGLRDGPTGGQNVQVNIGLVDREILENARARMRDGGQLRVVDNELGSHSHSRNTPQLPAA